MSRSALPRRSSARAPFAAIVLLGLAACASPPPVHFHTLMPAELGQPAKAPEPGPIAFALDAIQLPAQVDQPQWLVRLPDDSLVLLEQERWASPLRDEFREALLEELAVRYGAIERPARASERVVRIAIDVRRFDSVPGREARIEGSWTLESSAPNHRLWHCDWLVREAAGAGMPALAAAHRRAVIRLGDAIGDSLIAIGRGKTASCPVLDATG